jgi:hypothetical protein
MNNNTITPNIPIVNNNSTSNADARDRLSNTILDNQSQGLIPVTPDVLEAALTDFTRPDDLNKAIKMLKERSIIEGHSGGAKTFDWLMENQDMISRAMRSFLAALTILVATGLTINYAVKLLIPGYNFIPKIEDKITLTAFSAAIDSVFFPIIETGSRILNDPFLRNISTIGRREKRELSRIKMGGKTRRKTRRKIKRHRGAKGKSKMRVKGGRRSSKRLLRKRSRRSRRTRRR